MDKNPDPSPASIYLLKRFVELNEVHQEALDKLKPGLWSRLIAAVHDKVNPFDVEDELLTTLNEQKEYVELSFILFLFLIIIFSYVRFSVLYSFDEHQLLFPIDGRDPTQAPINFLPQYFGRFASWQAGTAGVSYSYLLLLLLFTMLMFL